jgi:hypothetical protein
MDLSSALQLGCRDEFCYRLASAGVPFDPTSISLEPDYAVLFSRVTDGQVTGGENDLARRRRVASIAGGAVAGGVVLLLLLLIFYKRRRTSCGACSSSKAAAKKLRASDKDDGLPVKAPESNYVTNNITAGELGGGGYSGSSSSRSVSRVGAGMPRSRLIKHAVFDPESLKNGCSAGYVITNSNDSSPAAAEAIAAAAAAASPVAVHSAADVRKPWPEVAAGRQQQQQGQQQRQLADVYFHADSFKEWVAAASSVVVVDAAAAPRSSSSSSNPDSSSCTPYDNAPRTPDSAALELAAALPASPISQPMYSTYPGVTFAEAAGSSSNAACSSSHALASSSSRMQQQ